jgi:hypothetical protein
MFTEMELRRLNGLRRDLREVASDGKLEPLPDGIGPTDAEVRYDLSQQAYRDRIAARKARQRAGGA